MTILFYLLILAITCLLRYPRRHNVNAWFVNMVFSDKHKILTKKLYPLKGYNARQLRTEFPNKGRTPKSSINRLLKKFRDTGTVDRCQSSDRLRSVRTDENNDQVRWTIRFSVKRTNPNSAQSVKYHGRQSSVVRIIRKDLQLKCFKRRRAQELTEANCTDGKLLLKTFFQFAADLIFFTDEKVFTVAAVVKELWKSVKVSPS